MRVLCMAVAFGAAGMCFGEATAQELEGRWEGRARVGGQSMALVVEVTQDDAGALAGSLSLPTRSIFDRPVSVEIEGDAVTLSLVRDGALGDATLAGRIDDGLWRGAIDAVNTSGMTMAGAFVMVQVTEVERASLESRIGEYAVEGLGLVRIALEETPSGARLTAFSEAIGSTTELFALDADRFVIGLDPQDEQPIEAELTFDEGEGFTLRMGEQLMSASRYVREFTIDADRVESIVRRAMAEGDVPSVVVAFVHGDDVVYAKAFGYADLENGRQATLETPYQIGSITKTFTATLLALAREEGLVSLDDPVEALLPEGVRMNDIAEEDRPAITLERLATHTSGLTRDPWNLRRRNGVKQPYEVDALYQAMDHARTVHAPGERVHYSNFAYGLLGHVVSRVGGQTYEVAIHERILAPLGMDSTFVAFDDERLQDIATHYWVEDTPRVARPAWPFGEVAGNGGLVSTIGDMAKWASLQLAVANGRETPIDRRALRAAQSPRVYLNGPMHMIGLSWFLDFSPERGLVISHGGEVDGHASHLAVAPAQDMGVVVMGNLGGGAIGTLGDALVDVAIEQARAQRLATADEAIAALRAGSWGDTGWAYEQLFRANPENGQAAYRMAASRLALRQLDAALEGFTHAAALGYFPGEAHFGVASVHALRGDASAAVAALMEAAPHGAVDAERLRTDTDFDSIRDDPAFREFVASLDEPVAQ